MKNLVLGIALLIMGISPCWAQKSPKKNKAAKTVAVAVTETKQNLPLQAKWRSHSGVPFTDDNFQSVTLGAPENKDIQDSFGNFVEFSADGTFRAYYNAPCGNDCFTTVTGTYKVPQENQLQISVRSIDYSGMGGCAKNGHFDSNKVYLYKTEQKDSKLLLSIIEQ